MIVLGPSQPSVSVLTVADALEVVIGGPVWSGALARIRDATWVRIVELASCEPRCSSSVITSAIVRVRWPPLVMWLSASRICSRAVSSIYLPLDRLPDRTA